MNLTLHVWRQKNAERQGPLRHLRGARRQPGHVLPRDARRGQRGAHAGGRGPDRLRPRLPRGHLRHVQHRRERSAARAAHAHDRLPAAHAQLPGRRHAGGRALARQGLSRDQGPGRGPRRPRRASSRRAASSRSAPAAPPRRTPSRCRRPTRSRPWTRPRASAAGPASPPARTPRPCCSRPPRSRTWASCRRASPSATCGCARWSRRWTAPASAAARTTRECEAACPKGIHIGFIARMNRDFWKASLLGAEESKTGGGA